MERFTNTFGFISQIHLVKKKAHRKQLCPKLHFFFAQYFGRHKGTKYVHTEKYVKIQCATHALETEFDTLCKHLTPSVNTVILNDIHIGGVVEVA